MTVARRQFLHLAAGAAMSTPIRRIVSGCCCARAMSGHVAALPSPAMNSLRFIR
jgi:hypothetical protein